MESFDTTYKNESYEESQSYINTAYSLKASFVFQSKGSFLESQEKLSKNRGSEITQCSDTYNLSSQHRQVGNFHSKYLKFGQWPEMDYQRQKHLKKSYRNLKNKLSKAENEKQHLILQPCANCEVLEEKQRNTEKALADAMQLSNILLKQVYNLDNQINQPQESKHEENEFTFSKIE
mmetsp:Transcript_8769/g.13059  ORF Transcript_8769/g.13059 Transcript_8769/m.13059 type:complete len:177 (-) Transcript_8769:62-592(-)